MLSLLLLKLILSMLHINGSLHNTLVLPLSRHFQGKENVLMCICLCISLRQMSYNIRLWHNMKKKNWSLETTKRKRIHTKAKPYKSNQSGNVMATCPWLLVSPYHPWWENYFRPCQLHAIGNGDLVHSSP